MIIGYTITIIVFVTLNKSLYIPFSMLQFQGDINLTRRGIDLYDPLHGKIRNYSESYKDNNFVLRHCYLNIIIKTMESC